MSLSDLARALAKHKLIVVACSLLVAGLFFVWSKQTTSYYAYTFSIRPGQMAVYDSKTTNFYTVPAVSTSELIAFIEKNYSFEVSPIEGAYVQDVRAREFLEIKVRATSIASANQLKEAAFGAVKEKYASRIDLSLSMHQNQMKELEDQLSKNRKDFATLKTFESGGTKADVALHAIARTAIASEYAEIFKQSEILKSMINPANTYSFEVFQMNLDKFPSVFPNPMVFTFLGLFVGAFLSVVGIFFAEQASAIKGNIALPSNKR